MKLKLLAAAMMAAGLALSGCASKSDNNASTGSSRTAGEVTSDAALVTKVKTALATDTGLGNAANINVNSYRGVVQLNGFVESQDKISRAVDAARRVDGVKSVDNNLRVKPGA